MTWLAKTLRRSLAWGFVDQSLSSLTNFAIALAAARSLTPSQFGGFSLVFSTYLLALGLGRASASEVLVVRYGSVSVDTWRQRTSQAAAMSLALGAVLLLVLVGASRVVPNDLAASFAALGLFLPGLLLQDCWRFAFFARSMGRSAALNDLVWAIALAGALLFVSAADTARPEAFIVAWGASATVAAVIGAVQTRLRPTGGTIEWVRSHRPLILRFGGEFVSTVGAQQLVFYGVAIFAGLSGVAAIRGAQLLLGPLNILFMGTQLVLVPESVRLATQSVGSMRRFVALSAMALGVVALLWGAASSIVLEFFGSRLLGETSESVPRVLLPLVLVMCASGVTIGALTGLRALADARRSLRTRLIASVLLVTCGVVGAAIRGEGGAAWGLAGAMLVSSVIWWRQLDASVAAAPLAISGESSTPEHSVVPGPPS